MTKETNSSIPAENEIVKEALWFNIVSRIKITVANPVSIRRIELYP